MFNNVKCVVIPKGAFTLAFSELSKSKQAKQANQKRKTVVFNMRLLHAIAFSK